MSYYHKRRNQKGYTLIELLVVVVVIGIIAALAIPRFMATTAKSKTGEAQTILKQMLVMQRAYRQEYDVYWGNGVSADKGTPNNFARINVSLMSSARYTYSITADQWDFTCTATANLDDDATVDTWTVDGSGSLINTISDVTD